MVSWPPTTTTGEIKPCSTTNLALQQRLAEEKLRSPHPTTTSSPQTKGYQWEQENFEYKFFLPSTKWAGQKRDAFPAAPKMLNGEDRRDRWNRSKEHGHQGTGINFTLSNMLVFYFPFKYCITPHR